MFTLVGLTACTPEVKGLSGVTVDDAGRPLAVLTWCAKRPPTTVVIEIEEPRSPAPRSPASSGAATPSPSGPFAWPGQHYDVPSDATSPITVSLEDFEDQATASEQRYRLSAVGDNNRSGTRAVVFALTDLTGLTPGSILVSSYARGGGLVHEQVSLEEFSRRGDDLC